MWRVAHGRVLLRLVDGDGFELTGDAAAVWLACDEPADQAQIEARLAESGPAGAQLNSAVQQCVDNRLMIAIE